MILRGVNIVPPLPEGHKFNLAKWSTVEPLLYDHPQNHIGVVAREGFVYKQNAQSVTRNVVV